MPLVAVLNKRLQNSHGDVKTGLRKWPQLVGRSEHLTDKWVLSRPLSQASEVMHLPLQMLRIGVTIFLGICFEIPFIDFFFFFNLNIIFCSWISRSVFRARSSWCLLPCFCSGALWSEITFRDKWNGWYLEKACFCVCA